MAFLTDDEGIALLTSDDGVAILTSDDGTWLLTTDDIDMKVHSFSMTFAPADDLTDGTSLPDMACISLYIGRGAIATEIPIYSPFVGYGDSSTPTVGLDVHSADFSVALTDMAVSVPLFVATL